MLIKLENQTVYKHFPILSTSKVLLQQGRMYILGTVTVFIQQHSSDLNMCDNFNKGKFFRNSELFQYYSSCSSNYTLWYNDFQVSNQLRNKIKKHKISAFYFVFGNAPAKYRSRLKNIQLALLYASALNEKCGNKEMLQPLINDMKILETSSFWRGRSQGTMNDELFPW